MMEVTRPPFVPRKTLGKRGFATLATGSLWYYKLARNLLYSYRRFTGEPVPFAIICDRENEYTREFDHVVILSSPTNSYMDKLRIFQHLPYEQTIFIESDCLAYGDLNAWWELFAGAGDFSLFGYAYRDLNTQKGWFLTQGMGEYAHRIQYVPSFSGGVLYLRNTEVCARVFEIAMDGAKRYHQLAFRVFPEPADEPVLALGMAVTGCEPVDHYDVHIAPALKWLDADITVPRAEYRLRGKDPRGARLIHFSSYRTKQSFYKMEAEKLLRMCAGTDRGLAYTVGYRWGLRRWILRLGNIPAFFGRFRGKIRRELRLRKKRRG